MRYKEIVGTFYQKELQKANQKRIYRRKKKRKDDKLQVKWKSYDNSFNTWIDKKRYCYIKMSYFLPDGHSKNKREVQLDLSNYATKPDFKNATGVVTSQFAKKDDLANLKLEVDKLERLASKLYY